MHTRTAAASRTNSCSSDRFSRELVPQTIGFLERAKPIEDGERLLRERRGLHVVTREPFGAAQCSQRESEFVLGAARSQRLDRCLEPAYRLLGVALSQGHLSEAPSAGAEEEARLAPRGRGVDLQEQLVRPHVVAGGQVRVGQPRREERPRQLMACRLGHRDDLLEDR